MFTLYTGNFHPPFAQGLVRDIRIRWALEEAGFAYETKALKRDDLETSTHHARQPFGQIPALEEDGFCVFESGASVLHISERSEHLLPVDPKARARAQTWMFAAVASVEPHVQNLCRLDLFPTDPHAAALARPPAEGVVKLRLSGLANWLADRDYLEDRFTAGDLLMASVLKMLRHTHLVAEHDNVRRYLERCEDRPAYRRALADHMALYETA